MDALPTMDVLYAIIGLVVANLIIGVVCGLASPRAWGRWLCLGAIVTTALPLLWIVKVFVAEAHLKESTAGIFALPGLLLVGELLWLAKVYLDGYRRCEPPPGLIERTMGPTENRTGFGSPGASSKQGPQQTFAAGVRRLAEGSRGYKRR